MAEKKNGFFYALLASLVIHLIAMIFSRYLPIPPTATAGQTSQIEIEIRDPNEVIKIKKSQDFVRETLIPDDIRTKESMDPLAFFSNQNQKVKKQLKALLNGATQNRVMMAPQGIEGPKRERKVAQPDLFRLATKEKAPRAPEPQQEDQQSRSVFVPQGLSTISQNLPEEVEVGEFTALNTDRYLYYSFFSRIEELIRTPWEDGIRATTFRTPKGVFQANLSTNYVTRIEIMLKPNGEFHKALLMKESGISGFDWAALDSFSSARLFPNPPHEMVEEDGFIHLHYVFTVRVNPKALAKQN